MFRKLSLPLFGLTFELLITSFLIANSVRAEQYKTQESLEDRFLLASLVRLSDSLSDVIASSQGVLAGKVLAENLGEFTS
jgi:hypothetical protein